MAAALGPRVMQLRTAAEAGRGISAAVSPALYPWLATTASMRRRHCPGAAQVTPNPLTLTPT